MDMGRKPLLVALIALSIAALITAPASASTPLINVYSVREDQLTITIPLVTIVTVTSPNTLTVTIPLPVIVTTTSSTSITVPVQSPIQVTATITVTIQQVTVSVTTTTSTNMVTVQVPPT